jgi:hypothetical protein
MIVQHAVSSSPYRTLAIIWTRAALVGALILGTAALAPRLLGRLEQNRDRDEFALVNERQQLVILDAIFQTYRLVRDEPRVDRTPTML